MKHKQQKKTLGRKSFHRTALLKQLTGDLLEHGSLVTTDTKAKLLRTWFEPLVTLARKDLTLANRRLLLSRMRGKADVERLVEKAENFKQRPGGYTRLTKQASTRHDGAPLTKIEIL